MMSFFKKPNLNFSVQTEEGLKAQISGKTFLVVSGTKGIGAALVDSLAKRDGRVVTTGREWPKDKPQPDNVEFIKADLSSVRGCLDFARLGLQGRTFDTVVFTIGIISKPNLTRTVDGLEEDLAVSYLTRFILVNELIRSNALVGRKRIYIFGFPGQDQVPTDVNDMNFERTEYKQWPAHMNTVVFNEALVYELAKRHPDLHVFGLNPGILPTGIRDNMHGGPSTYTGKAVETLISWVMPKPEQYVERCPIQLIASPEYDNKTGICFSRKGEELQIPKWQLNENNRTKVWENSEALVASALKTSENEFSSASTH